MQYLFDVKPFKERLSELIRTRDFDTLSDTAGTLEAIAESFGLVSEFWFCTREFEKARQERRRCKRVADRMATVRWLLEYRGINPITGEIADHTWSPVDDDDESEAV
jgi:hypothetical protein